MHVATNEAQTTHAIVEGSEALGKESKQVLHHVSAVNLHENTQDSGCNGSVCDMMNCYEHLKVVVLCVFLKMLKTNQALPFGSCYHRRHFVRSNQHETS